MEHINYLEQIFQFRFYFMRYLTFWLTFKNLNISKIFGKIGNSIGSWQSCSFFSGAQFNELARQDHAQIRSLPQLSFFSYVK